MLKIENKLSEVPNFVTRTELTDTISRFNILSPKASLRFSSNSSCVCIIFNYGTPIKIQLNAGVNKITSNNFNAIKIQHKNQKITFSGNKSNLLMDIITLPLTLFNEIAEYFSIDLTDEEFVFPESKVISDEIRYNLQTLYIENNNLVGTNVYVHGKVLIILALQLLELGIVKKTNAKKLVVKNYNELYSQMNRVEKIVRDDWTNAYSLKDLAKIIGTNECYLKRDFKTVFGFPISTYRLKKKMEEANNLLLHSHENIKSISKKLGYKYTTHFTSAYKKYYKMTPGELRKLHLGNT